jgi:hypothetical protein
MEKNEDLVKLLGTWETDTTDAEAISEYGQTAIEFSSDGQHVYTIHTPEKVQKTHCIYYDIKLL